MFENPRTKLPSFLLGNLARMSYAPLRSPTTAALS